MKELISNVYNYDNWLFTWQYFLIGIPVAFIVFIIIMKLATKEVLYEDVPLAFGLALAHQLWLAGILMFGPLVVLIFPFVLLYNRFRIWWDKVKEKKIF